MEFIMWKDAYSVGYAKIDEQHKKIIKLINDLYSAYMKKSEPVSITRIMSELTSYAKEHFSEEERLFRQYNYIETEEHTKEHALFTRKIGEFVEECGKNEHLLSMKLTTFLQKWLINHILESDMKYKGQLDN
jgi:hemerythrin